MLVCRLCVFDSASLWSGDRRGEGLVDWAGSEGKERTEGMSDEGVLAANPAGDAGFEFSGGLLTVALHASSRSIGERRLAANRSFDRSGD